MGIYRDLFKIAIPVALQQFLFSSVSFLDTLMIGRLGEDAIAAIGLANQFFFFYNIVLFGLVSGGAIFFSQFWGKGDFEGLSKSTALTTLSSLFVSIPFFVLSLFFPGYVMRFFSPDPIVIELGVKYIKILSISFPIFAISMVFSFMLRSIHKAHIPMYTTIIELTTNVFLNYVLIFGNFGFPKLGVIGAAIATVFSRIIGLFVLIVTVKLQKLPGMFSLHHIGALNKNFINRFFHYTLPTLANEFAWSLGFTMYSVIYAHMSTKVIAARNIIGTIEGFAWAFSFSLANAASVIIGNYLGAKRFGEAYKISRKIIKLTEIVATISAAATYILTVFSVDLFNISQDVKSLVIVAMAISMGFVPIKIFNGLNIVGFLRAGGDTRFSFAVEATTLWVLGVPLAAIGGLILKLSFPLVLLLTMVDEITKFFILLSRYKSRKWVRNVVENI
ncbi:multidrug transporter MATE [Thermosipho melanesiensis]|uniref:MATE efflux family protein n=2 Tax=Thermosipho melanesiensis TaxID=46541 RepID=A6LL90_THEM4|nr:MATE family efflux transporter [Thermosipho melanesiensis]ABR30691.1 MATE efflux family protein [Thermosipho melanesiensis BI429]APT73822.1 multidrug transporter MATE [Thermosipho melanesiensis]OOC35760.1 multidrug transporter MATE [Thermosipho melanesiensis]OOC39059.1 multidrug transporter MATE [Thermosipho melanesiensis]OOC39207.1 multidrug transporter MATE [Thermosipho melanesiensis]